MEKLERDIRFLKRYAIISTTLMIVLSAAAFTRSTAHAKFDEIDVERINIREPNGNYRMVLSNRPRSIGPIYKNKEFGRKGGDRPGIIFFNDEGPENGGLTFAGATCKDGKSEYSPNGCKDGTYAASTHMSFDQFNQDQVVNLDYSENNGQRLMGFTINDRAQVDIYDMVAERDSIMTIADTVARRTALLKWGKPRNGVPLAVQRLFVGRDRARSAVLNLADPNGKVRLRLAVDSLGAPHMHFLDENGRVTYMLPP